MKIKNKMISKQLNSKNLNFTNLKIILTLQKLRLIKNYVKDILNKSH